MRQSVFQSFVLIAGMAVALNVLVYLGLDGILWCCGYRKSSSS